MLALWAAAVLSFGTLGQAQRWEEPYEIVKKPLNYLPFAERLSPKGAGIFLKDGRLTFLAKGEKNSIRLPDWLNVEFVRDNIADVWVAQASMKDWDRSFFTYGQQEDGKSTRPVFYGPRSPKPPNRAAVLAGSIQTIPFASKELGESRNVTVYLPPHPGPNLNAVYMADGQSCEAFARVLEPLILAKRVAPTAIVGLFHGEYKGDIAQYDFSKDFRAKEYLKVADPDRFESHLRFVTEEVRPWAEGRFGLGQDASHRALFGFSNGAAFSLVASVERPDLFSAVLPFSVAVFDREELAKNAARKRLPHYWLAAGTLESFIKNTQEAAKILQAHRASVHIASYVSGHDEAMWRLAFANALPKVFPGQK